MRNPVDRRWWALGGVMLAVLAVGLDASILSVALPTLATALHASESDLQWFSSAYFLALAAVMLPAGLLGDRYGRRRVMLVALALFGAGSAACAYAPSTGAFIAARVGLGVAGAGIVVMAVSALTVLFTEEERPRAVGIWAAANFLALPIGPILGGWLLTRYWWGWVFLINVPVALVGLAAAFALVPESRAPQRPGLDPLGVLGSTAGMGALTYGMIQAGQEGWGGGGALLPMIAGLAVLVGFFLWERRLGRRPGGQPLIDLALFRSAAFTWGVLLSATGVLALTGVIFTMPQYFQGVLGTDALGSGLRLLPLVAGMVAGALPADRVARRLGAKVTVGCGFGLLAAGLAVGTGTGAGSGGGFLGAWMAVVGAGIGLAMATTASTALGQLSPERSGVGSAVMQAFQKAGGPFGSAIMGSVLISAYQARLDVAGLPARAADLVRQSIFDGLAVARQVGSAPLAGSVRSAFAHGTDVALTVSAGIAVAGLVLAIAFLPGRKVSGAAEAGRLEQEAAVATRR